ncbi:unnamed protein product [Schistosoma mattheei]|nr:unnamed protein product [Schistosoma mattheei]
MNEIYQRKRSLLKANELTSRLQRHGCFGDGTVENGVRTCVNYGYANGVEH